MVEITFVLYTLVSLPVAYAVFTDKHKGCLAVIAPFVGGAFISSAILFFVTQALYHPSCEDSDKVCTLPHPRKGQWVNFFTMTFQHIVSTPADEDFGIFYNSTVNISTNRGVVFADHILLLVVWLLVWFAGYKVQMNKMNKVSDAREALKEGLLHHE